MTFLKQTHVWTVIAALLSSFCVSADASSEDLCAPLQHLLAAAPAAFISGRGTFIGLQQWKAAPIVPTADCTLWGAREDDAYNLRCSIHDGTDPAPVQSFYKQNVAALEKCLPLFGGPPWQRKTQPVAMELLRGEETIWVQQTPAVRLEINLASYERTATTTFYDNLSVDYLRY